MRKLKLQVQMTVDGFIAGDNGEMDFMVWNWDEELNSYVESLTSTTDSIVLGRKLAEGFIPYWASVAADSGNPENASGKFFTDTHKVVFSKTLKSAEWPNTDLANGDLVEEISKLKNQEGNDIIAYGGAGFVSALIKHNLIDAYHLFINPVAIGKGKAIFQELESRRELKLVQAKAFGCGIVLLHYEPKKD